MAERQGWAGASRRGALDGRRLRRGVRQQPRLDQSPRRRPVMPAAVAVAEVALRPCSVIVALSIRVVLASGDALHRRGALDRDRGIGDITPGLELLGDVLRDRLPHDLRVDAEEGPDVTVRRGLRQTIRQVRHRPLGDGPLRDGRLAVGRRPGAFQYGAGGLFEGRTRRVMMPSAAPMTAPTPAPLPAFQSFGSLM